MSSLGSWKSGAERGGLGDRLRGSAEVRPIAFARRCQSWTSSAFRSVLGNAHLGDGSLLGIRRSARIGLKQEVLLSKSIANTHCGMRPCTIFGTATRQVAHRLRQRAEVLSPVSD